MRDVSSPLHAHCGATLRCTALRKMQFLIQSTIVYSLTIEMVGGSTAKAVQGAVAGTLTGAALGLSVYAP